MDRFKAMARTFDILQLSPRHLGCRNYIILTWVCYIQLLAKVVIYSKLWPRFGIGPGRKVIRNVHSLHQLARHQKSSVERCCHRWNVEQYRMTGVQACLTSTMPIQCTPVCLFAMSSYGYVILCRNSFSVRGIHILDSIYGSWSSRQCTSKGQWCCIQSATLIVRTSNDPNASIIQTPPQSIRKGEYRSRLVQKRVCH